MSEYRSPDKAVRDLADRMFTDLLLGTVRVKNPEFQSVLEQRIDLLVPDSLRFALARAEQAERERDAALAKLDCPICKCGPDCSGRGNYICEGCWHDRTAEKEIAEANAIPEDARERIALLLRERSPVPRAYRGGVSAWYPEADAVLAALRRPA